MYIELLFYNQDGEAEEIVINGTDPLMEDHHPEEDDLLEDDVVEVDDIDDLEGDDEEGNDPLAVCEVDFDNNDDDDDDDHVVGDDHIVGADCDVIQERE